jgi:hypothetical protein
VDDIVLQAMMRWPNVPSVYGWLKLDRRGRWLIKGEPITNPTITAFIGRNYLRTEQGQWCFQNGPQRVFVELEYMPYVYHVWRNGDGSLAAQSHTGVSVEQPSHCWIDDAGGVILKCEPGIGCVEAQSLATLAELIVDSKGYPLSDDAIETLLRADSHIGKSSRLQWNEKLLPIDFVLYDEEPSRFGFERIPQPPPGAPLC